MGDCKGDGVPLRGGRIKILWNYLVMMVAQLNEYTETHRIICFNIMNFMLNELYLFFFSRREQQSGV